MASERQQLTKADYKRMYEEEKAKNVGLSDIKKVEGTLNNTIQWRESDGIYVFLTQKAKGEKLSVNEYCKKMIRAKLGYH